MAAKSPEPFCRTDGPRYRRTLIECICVLKKRLTLNKKTFAVSHHQGRHFRKSLCLPHLALLGRTGFTFSYSRKFTFKKSPFACDNERNSIPCGVCPPVERGLKTNSSLGVDMTLGPRLFPSPLRQTTAVGPIYLQSFCRSRSWNDPSPGYPRRGGSMDREKAIEGEKRLRRPFPTQSATNGQNWSSSPVRVPLQSDFFKGGLTPTAPRTPPFSRTPRFRVPKPLRQGFWGTIRKVQVARDEAVSFCPKNPAQDHPGISGFRVEKEEVGKNIGKFFE